MFIELVELLVLDEVDKALEARSYCFARYADDCNVYVGSTRAGERVMAYLRKLYTGLKLQINEAKSAVASACGRKFLGYALWVAKGKEVKCAVAYKALDNFKARIRQLTRRSGGRSMAQVVEKLRLYLLGWKAYFGLIAQMNNSTELGGVIATPTGYTVVFAGEAVGGRALDNARARTADPRNLAVVHLRRDFDTLSPFGAVIPDAAMLTRGPAETGGFFTFGGTPNSALGFENGHIVSKLLGP
jgi:hypothetical protein